MMVRADHRGHIPASGTFEDARIGHRCAIM